MKASELAGSLATVAIAVLGGPLSVTRAGLSEVVKYAQSRYAENEQARRVHTTVTQAVNRWADGERLDSDGVALGLTFAAETVAQFGLTTDSLTELGFDSKIAAAAVVDAARESDKEYWGTEDFYVVAVRAIETTYAAIIAQLQNDEKILIPVFLSLRSSIDYYAVRIQHRFSFVEASLADLCEALTNVPTVADAMSYLRLRIEDWDVSDWRRDQRPSVLERHLKVRDQSSGHISSPEDALKEARTLVLLGGPGAGKTWLARRYARQAAQIALSRLEDGAGLDAVELPVVTSWSQWAKTFGSPRQALVTSSLASGNGHRDIGGSDGSQRIEQMLLRPDAKVLVVVDSLDESADVTAQGTRLRELEGLPAGWRALVTSRPAAWKAANRERTPTIEQKVFEIEELSYPGDVEGFIHAWFEGSDEAKRGHALIRDIHRRREVARIATVPLMLTFYCIIADEPTLAGSEFREHALPARRRQLYASLVRRLLRGEWADMHPGPDGAPDIGYCEGLLGKWAWEAVRDRSDAVGLGRWDDTVIQHGAIAPNARRPIDNVAPKTMQDAEGTITRRFVHRTVLEHFVAEYIATLDAPVATDLLLPHLWFDPDWQVAAPAAVVAHNQRHPEKKGALLQGLLDLARKSVTDPAKVSARRELECFLLAVANESEPDSWTDEQADLIHQCRIDHAAAQPNLIAQSAHWTGSNREVRQSLMQTLAGTVDSVFLLAHALGSLEPTRDERKEISAALVRALTATDDPDVASYLAQSLYSMASTADERANVLQALVQALTSTRNARLADGVAKIVLTLATTRNEGDNSRAAILQALSNREMPWMAASLAAALEVSALTKDERREARKALLHALIASGNRAVPDVLTALAPTEAEREETRASLLQALAHPTNPFHVGKLARALMKLGATQNESGEARVALLRALTNNENPWQVGKLTEALMALHPPHNERVKALGALVRALSHNREAWVATSFVGTVMDLKPSKDDRKKVRAALAQILTHTPNPDYADKLAHALSKLAPDQDERAEVRRALVQAIKARPHPERTRQLAKSLTALTPTREERKEVRCALMQVPKYHGRDTDLGEILAALAPTPDERSEVRATLMQEFIIAEDPEVAADLAQVLVTFTPNDDEREALRNRLIEALATSRNTRWFFRWAQTLASLATTTEEREQIWPPLVQALTATQDLRLADTLIALAITSSEREIVRAILLQMLAENQIGWEPRIMRALVALGSTQNQREEARRGLLRVLTATQAPRSVAILTESLRAISSVQQWMDWLAGNE